MNLTHKIKFIIFLLLFSIPMVSHQVLAGGIMIDDRTLLVNDSRKPFVVELDNRFQMDFMADQYIYGRRGDKGYIVFVLEKEPEYTMKSSVGKNCTNRKDDIKFIKSKLNQFGFWPYDIDGKWNQNLLDAIFNYQKSLGFKRPDGVIEKGGITHRELLGYSQKILIPLIFQDGTNPRPVGQPMECRLVCRHFR